MKMKKYSRAQIAELNDKFRNSTPSEVIRWAISKRPPSGDHQF